MTSKSKHTFILDADDRSKAALKSMKSNLKGIAQVVFGLSAAYAGLRIASTVINSHREFTAAISDLSAITGATGKDLDFLRKKSLEYGATTTLTATQVAEAFKLVASAKPDLLENASALAMVTKEVIALAEASGAALPEAAKILGSTLNQFGASADQASRFVNVLAAGAKFGASEIADTSMALKDVGLVAAGAGTSFEELNAALQAMAAVSIKGSEAGVGLRNVYLNLASQSNAKFKPSVVGLTQAIKNLKAAQLSDVQLLEIFGKKNIIAAKALISQSDSLGTLTEKLTGTTTAYDQAAIKVDNLDGDIKKMNSAWESTALLLGAVFDPALRGVVQLLTWTSKVVKSIIIAIKDMGDAIGAYAAAAVAALSLDFKGASAILKARKAEAAANEEALTAIWKHKKAVVVAAESEAVSIARLAKLKAEAAEKAKQAIKINLATEVEAINTSLLTAEEKLRASYEKRSNILRDALNRDVITKAKFDKLKAKLDADRAKKMLAITKKKGESALAIGKKQALAGLGLTKVIALRQGLIDAKAAILGAYKWGNSWGGPVAGAVAAAGAVAFQAPLLADLGGAVTGGGGGGGTPAPVASATPEPITPTAGAGAGQAGGVITNTAVAVQQPITIMMNDQPLIDLVVEATVDGRITIDQKAVA